MTENNVHTFSGGMQSDIDDHIKTKNTFIFGENGTLFSEDGTLAFTSVKGTEEVLNDSRIVKYLGAESFHNELVVFVKVSGVDVNLGSQIFTSINRSIPNITGFEIALVNNQLKLTDEISDNSNVVTYTEQIIEAAQESEIILQDNYDPEETARDTIDFDTYYKTNANVPNFKVSEIQEGSIPENNVNFADAIISITKDANGNFSNRVLWAGYQNWAINAKIVALGVDENSNYRRIKYTDFQNTFKSINVLDAELSRRSAEELENFQSTVQLEPRILEVNNNGQLTSMAVQYSYRLITDNGQVTDFSPLSKVQYIYPDNSVAIEGGSLEELTNKSVKVECNIVNPTGFAEIECIALEFESGSLPTSIKTLGIKGVDNVVEFDHYGNESDLGSDVNVNEVLSTISNWKYCSDLETKNNKLFAFGLRNDPLTNQYERLKILFSLHGWDSNGNTHSSFLNPSPKTYNLIPPNYREQLFYSRKRTFSEIRSFGKTKMILTNSVNGESISVDTVNENNIYHDVTQEIATFLLQQQSTNLEFSNIFPNIEIVFRQNIILIQSIDESIETDISNIKMTFSNVQVLFDVNDENIFFTNNIASQRFVHGALSPGFNLGTGIRISFRNVEDLLLNKAVTAYAGNGSVLDMPEPTLKKSFMKNEIYRLAIQLYRDGERIFAIPMGDIHIPKLGSTYSYINDSGNVVITSEKYVNQKVVGNSLYGVRTEMHIETRFDEEFSREFDMFQIVYVERTENNRSVLCQGISAPLMRVQDPEDFHSYSVDERLQRKWTLPYHGGPIYDKEGFDLYDEEGEDFEEETYDDKRRVINSRKLFYFDAPDLVYQNISPSLIENSSLKVVGKLNTDHDDDTIMISGQDIGGFPEQRFPKFSNKILQEQLETRTLIDDLPQRTGDDNADDDTWQTHFVNVSVFSEFTPLDKSHTIEGAVDLGRGEVIPGTDLDTSFDVSNNAFCLPNMPWWYSDEVRRIREEDDQHGFEAYTRGAVISPGSKTQFIKTTEDLFTDEFLGNSKSVAFPTQIRRGGSGFNYYDGYALINIERDNESSIYGGRSERDFAKNVFIALSETKPIATRTNAAQIFNIEGDTYVTLWARTKNGHGDEDEVLIDRRLNNGRTDTASSRGDLEEVFRLNNAWCYACVIETMIEPKLNDEYEFYRETSSIDFSIPKEEVLNNAYLKINNFRRHIPKPFRFQDDPNLDNIVAASEVKLSGETYDAWSSFPINEFQELDKNKGAVLNSAKIKDNIYAIQERQTSILYIDRNVIIPAEGDNPITVRQGSGRSIEGYKVESSYGTSIRRSLAKHPDFGFMFVDDTKNVLVKNFEELTLKNQYHHEFYNQIDDGKIIDVNGFFDEEHKETCLNIVTDKGSSMIKYNEVLGVLTGWREMNASIYMPFDGKIYIPRETVVSIDNNDFPNSQSLHELNRGLYLNVLGKELKMKISYICSPNADETFIFPHIAWVLNDLSDFESITLTTKEGFVRQLLPTHGFYKKREGKHTIPTLNYFKTGDDSDEKIDVRSEFVLIEFVFPYNEGTLKKLNRVVNYVRKSYQ